VVEFLKRQGRNREAITNEERMDRRYDLEQQAARERSFFRPQDTYLPHGLPAERAAEIAASVPTDLKIKELYLVRKECKLFPHLPCFLLAFKLGYQFIESSNRAAKAMEKVAASLDAHDNLMVVCLTGNDGGLRRRIRKVPGGRIR